ncbi:MAG: PUA domain-containing protein [Promethearchaeota archaeon]
MSVSESSKFRQINEIEKKIIFQSFSNISPNLVEFIRKSKNFLYISLKDLNSRKVYPKIYLVSNHLLKKINLIDLNSKISSIGLYFGFIKKGKFYLSLEGAEFLYREGIFSGFKYIQVNDGGEKSVLYGNNILKSMVNELSSNLRKGDFLLIFNNTNEILAIAQSKVDCSIIDTLKLNSIIAVNLSDKGVYLRENQ